MKWNIVLIGLVSIGAICFCSCDPPEVQKEFEPNYEKAGQREAKRAELQSDLKNAAFTEELLPGETRAVVLAALAVARAEYELSREMGAGDASLKLETLREAKAKQKSAEEEYQRGIATLRLGLPDSVANWQAWKDELMRGVSAYSIKLKSGGYTQAKPAEDRLWERMHDEPEPTSREFIASEEKRIERMKVP